MKVALKKLLKNIHENVDSHNKDTIASDSLLVRGDEEPSVTNGRIGRVL